MTQKEARIIGATIGLVFMIGYRITVLAAALTILGMWP